MGNVGIICGKPLPKSLGFLFLRRPEDRAATVDHFQTVSFHGETGRLTSVDLAQKMADHLAKTHQPLVIEASPLLLADDITGWVERAGLKTHLLQARSIFFCSDLYTPNGKAVGSFVFPRDPGQPLEIWVGSRESEHSFRDGYGYFEPLMASLTWLQSCEQSRDESTLDFLLSLNTVSAIYTLLGTSPLDRDRRVSLEDKLKQGCVSAQGAFGRLGTTRLELVADQALARYASLSNEVAAYLHGSLIPPSGN